VRPIGTLDSETDPFTIGREPRPFLWGFWDGQIYKEFRKPREVAEFLRTRHMIVYAHNGGKFDYMARDDDGDCLLNYMTPFEPITVINGRLAKFKIGLCELRDSWNILPVPLAAYKKDKIDYSIMERDQRYKARNWRAIRDYLKSDCIYLRELVVAFIEKFGLNLTQASAAMRYWRTISEQTIPVITGQEGVEFYDLFKPYYYGGRVESFRKGIVEERFSVADITSAYPFAMQEFHPFGRSYMSITKQSQLKGIALEGPSFYDVYGVSAGAFPFRGDDDGLEFPHDGKKRLYQVTGWELITALDLGLLRDWNIKACFRFQELNSFKEYIAHCWIERKKAIDAGDDANKLFYKLLMNSLYGKFAADPRNYGSFKIYPREYEPVLLSEKHEQETGEQFAGYMGPWILTEAPLKEDEQRFYNVATSASITGYVRAYLLRSMHKCRGVIYCDTDSIAAYDTSRLNFGKNLGDWQIEGEFDKAALAGKKLYAFRKTDKEFNKERAKDPNAKRWKVRSKGVRLTYQDLVKVAKGEVVDYMPEVPTYSVHHQPRFIKRQVRMT
jgi:hypothetical protein